MLEIGRRLDLRQKTLGAECRGEIGMQHLHRDPARVLHIFGEIDGGHSAGAEFSFDPVRRAERGLKCAKVAHWTKTQSPATSTPLRDLPRAVPRPGTLRTASISRGRRCRAPRERGPLAATRRMPRPR